MKGPEKPSSTWVGLSVIACVTHTSKERRRLRGSRFQISRCINWRINFTSESLVNWLNAHLRHANLATRFRPVFHPGTRAGISLDFFTTVLFIFSRSASRRSSLSAPHLPSRLLRHRPLRVSRQSQPHATGPKIGVHFNLPHIHTCSVTDGRFTNRRRTCEFAPMALASRRRHIPKPDGPDSARSRLPPSRTRSSSGR